MKNHIFFERLFEKSDPVKGLLCPFNIESLEDIDTSDSYFNKTLYRLSIPEENQKDIAYVNLIERAITRLVIPKLNLEYTGFGGYGFDNEGNFYCDYYDGTQVSFNESVAKGETEFGNDRHIILKIDTSGELYGSVIDAWGGEEAYLIKTRTDASSNRHSASAAIYACLAYIIAKHEEGECSNVSKIMHDHYKDIVDGYNFADMGTFAKATRSLDVDFYTLFQYPGSVQKAFGSLPLDPNQYLDPNLEKVEINSIPELLNLVGDSKVLKGEKREDSKIKAIKIQKKAKTMKELLKDDTYNLGMVLTKEEEMLVPKGFDDFIPSDITLDVAREIKVSSLDPVPARNVLWTGETGTGKTTESQMLARLLHLPYRSMNLSSDKLSSDILVSCLPNNGKSNIEDIRDILKSFPDAGTIAVNPDLAYEMLTGESKFDATEEDINKAKADKLLNVLNKANDFMYVDSPFVKTFRNGGVVELQEVNSCKAAILKSLNEALDDLNILHLPTGETVHRHENCIVIVTANVGQGYEGINNFSNDFIARFHQADVFELPDDKTLASRIKERSGYNNEKEIEKMIKVMHSIQRVLLETKGDYGSCSQRGLIAWARKTKNCKDPYLAGVKTIVGLATQDPEIRVELLHALETEFAPCI